MRKNAIHSANVRIRRPAFTLVELMVVIAIIAVLITILLPALSAVRTNVKVAATKTTISVLDTGITAFMADTRVGGSLPPSAAPTDPSGTITSGWAISPYTNTQTRIDGASLLFWALAGADLLGTPGFQDLDSSGSWANDTGSNAATGTIPAGLYCLNGTVPLYPRSGPFVDLGKMKIPQRTAVAGEFAVPAAKGAVATVFSPCFLDAWGQPILYYRASLIGTDIAIDPSVTPVTGRTGIYNLGDNARITGLANAASTFPGMNFGRGLLPTDSYHSAAMFHYLSSLGDVYGNTAAQVGAFLQLPAPARYSFGYTIWNPSVTAVPRPSNDKSYIMLSAGPDGVFGTPDDIANFEVNK